MAVVFICAGLYCRGPLVAGETAGRLGSELWDDKRLVGAVAPAPGPDAASLERALSASPSILDRLQHDQDRALAGLNLELSRLVSEGDLVLLGKCGHLIPRSLPPGPESRAYSGEKRPPAKRQAGQRRIGTGSRASHGQGGPGASGVGAGAIR